MSQREVRQIQLILKKSRVSFYRANGYYSKNYFLQSNRATCNKSTFLRDMFVDGKQQCYRVIAASTSGYEVLYKYRDIS